MCSVGNVEGKGSICCRVREKFLLYQELTRCGPNYTSCPVGPALFWGREIVGHESARSFPLSFWVNMYSLIVFNPTTLSILVAIWNRKCNGEKCNISIGAVVVWILPCSGICVEELMETAKDLTQNSRRTGAGSNRIPSEYMSGDLQLYGG